MNQLQSEKILVSLPQKYYVVDTKLKRIVQTNDEAVDTNKDICFKQVFHIDQPCKSGDNLCVCERMSKNDKETQFVFESGNGNNKRFYEVKASKLSEDLILAFVYDITEKEQLQKELKINSKRLNRAEKLADFGYWEFNIDDKQVIASEGAARIYGSPDTQLSLAEVQSFPLHEYRKMLDESLLNLIAQNKPYNVKFKIRRKTDGEIRHIHSIAEFRTDKRMVFGVLHDITEADKAQEALIESENNFQLLFKNMNSGFAFHKIVTDENEQPVDYTFLDVNNKFEQLTGLKRNEIIGKNIKEVFPGIENKWIERYGNVALTGNPANFSDYSADIDKHFEIAAYSPKKGYFAVTFTDVTKRKENESKLRLLQQTIEQTPLSVVITDTDGNIEYVNPGFEKATGYQREEAIGQNPSVLKSGTHDDTYYRLMWETICSGKNWYGEFHNKRKDGTLYWESVVIAPIVNEKNEIKQFVAIKEDITEIKKMVKDLEIAKDKAEESDRLKTVFLANMSHEIRTPLNGILGFSNLICSGLCDKDQLQQYGKIIENSGQRLMTVIDDIIDISMIQSNQLKIVYEYFDINELLEELSLAYKSQMEEKLHNIDFQLIRCSNTEFRYIYSDKNRVYQVFKNLLDNAFKFTEKGSINFGCISSEEEALVLFVKDTGIGIAENKIGLIFETFRQVEEGSARKYDGSGLGLAITSGIVEKLGGKIEVESELSKGTLFRVTLPRRNKMIIHDHKKSINKELNNKTMFKSKRIVSFEDDKTSYQYLKIAIDLLGYELVNFESVLPGIEYLKTNGADLVLMDIQLPEMNGYEATRIIKTDMPGIPVIIQSAFAMKEYRDKAMEAGSDDFISKPISLKTLREKLEKYFQQENVKIK